MKMLQSYRLGKLALKSIRTFMHQRKSGIQEIQIKRELLLKARCIKAWRHTKDLPVKQFKQHRVLSAWREAHCETRIEKFK
jgi:hypothetical protein